MTYRVYDDETLDIDETMTEGEDSDDYVSYIMEYDIETDLSFAGIIKTGVARLKP